MKASATSLPERSRAAISGRASSASARSASRKARACRPRARAASRGRAVRWAGDCRSPRWRDRRAVPHRSRRPWRCRAARRGLSRLADVARGDRVDARARSPLHRRDHLLDADLGDAEHAPGNLVRHCAPHRGLLPRLRQYASPAARRPAAQALRRRQIPRPARQRAGARASSRDIRAPARSPCRAPRSRRRSASSSAAARLSSSCSMVFAPTMTLMTPARCKSQASATCATETPCALATGSIASMMS